MLSDERTNKNRDNAIRGRHDDRSTRGFSMALSISSSAEKIVSNAGLNVPLVHFSKLPRHAWPLSQVANVAAKKAGCVPCNAPTIQ